MRVPAALYLLNICAYHYFQILAILVGVWWYVIVVLIHYILLMTKDAEHLLVCLLAIGPFCSLFLLPSFSIFN